MEAQSHDIDGRSNKNTDAGRLFLQPGIAKLRPSSAKVSDKDHAEWCRPGARAFDREQQRDGDTGVVCVEEAVVGGCFSLPTCLRSEERWRGFGRLAWRIGEAGEAENRWSHEGESKEFECS